MAFTRSQIIAILRANTDEGWLDAILADADSTAVLDALIAQLIRASVVVDHIRQAGTISEAPGARAATTTLTFTRATGMSGTIAKGTVFEDARRQRFFAVTDTPVATGATQTTLQADSERATALLDTVNEPDMRFSPVVFVSDVSNTTPIQVTTTTPHGLSSGDIVRVRDVAGNLGANGVFAVATGPTMMAFTLVGSTGIGPYVGGGFIQRAPLNWAVATSSPILGGSADFLAAQGRERGVLRQANEDDGHYRLRVRNIPDAVSPIAVADGVLGAAETATLPAPTINEPFIDGAATNLKAEHNLGSFDAIYLTGIEQGPSFGKTSAATNSPKVDFTDDAGSGREMLDLRQARAYFRIDFPGPIPDPDSSRMFYDDDFFDDPVFGFPDVSDHPQIIAGLMSVWEEANRKRAAGVQFDIYINDAKKKISVGAATGASEISVFTATAPSGMLWWYRDGFADHDVARGPTGATLVPTMYHRVKFTFEDATTFTTAPYRDVWTERLSISQMIAMGFPFKRISRIEGIARSDGTAILNVVGSFFLLEVAV